MGVWIAHPSCGWPPSHAVPLLPGHQPLFFRSCSHMGLGTKTQPFSLFPHAKPAGALGQCASPSWTRRLHRVTRGTSNLPGCVINFWCSQGLAGSVCLSPRGGKWGPPSTAAALHQGASPHPGVGTNQHQPAPGCPTTFLPAALGGGRTPSVSGSSPSAPPFLRTPSPGGSIPPCRGNASSRSLCFPFERRGGR